MICIIVIFFFKQKTAYEMRISDWSSDVCSSDLVTAANVATGDYVIDAKRDRLVIAASSLGTVFEWYDFFVYGTLAALIGRLFFPTENETAAFLLALATFGAGFGVRPLGAIFFGYLRSEEHTSELQSLMRISYAVFCLKKKN